MFYLIISIISGVISGLGMGGGTALILMFTAFLNIDQHVAQGTNLVFFIPMSIAAIILHIKNKNVDKNLVKKIIPLRDNWLWCWSIYFKLSKCKFLKKDIWNIFVISWCV